VNDLEDNFRTATNVGLQDIHNCASPASFFCVHLEGVSPTDADCNWKILRVVKPFFDVCKRGWILIDDLVTRASCLLYIQETSVVEWA